MSTLTLLALLPLLMTLAAIDVAAYLLLLPSIHVAATATAKAKLCRLDPTVAILLFGRLRK